jgi:HPt (histidine-containing phosphotransfer) domain-containing protein
MDGDRDRCLRAGMDAYVSKPFQAEELFATIEHLVKYYVSAVEDEEADDPGVAHAEPASGHIDTDEALRRVGGIPDILVEIVGLFLDEYPSLHDTLETALGAGDLVTAGSVAHRLKGDLGSLAARSASEAARRLEATAKSGDAVETARLWEEFKVEMELLQPELVAVSVGSFGG